MGSGGKYAVERRNTLGNETGNLLQRFIFHEYGKIVCTAHKVYRFHFGERRDLLGDTVLPKADVLIFRAEDGSKVIVRPSGTEPLIKCYLFVCGNVEDNKAKLAQITAQLDQLFGN